MKSSKLSETTTTVIAWVIIIGIIGAAILISSPPAFLKAYFAPTPKAKCEVYVESNDKYTYCNEDGNKGSFLDDCKAKTPYFEWKNNKCERVKYESREACIADGKEGTNGDGEGESWVTICQDDGTWKAKSTEILEYEDYLSDPGNVSCRDVTSYDYNWDNDMLCTNPDGSQFYTSYEGAALYQ